MVEGIRLPRLHPGRTLIEVLEVATKHEAVVTVLGSGNACFLKLGVANGCPVSVRYCKHVPHCATIDISAVQGKLEYMGDYDGICGGVGNEKQALQKKPQTC